MCIVTGCRVYRSRRRMCCMCLCFVFLRWWDLEKTKGFPNIGRYCNCSLIIILLQRQKSWNILIIVSHFCSFKARRRQNRLYALPQTMYTWVDVFEISSVMCRSPEETMISLSLETKLKKRFCSSSLCFCSRIKPIDSWTLFSACP